jgi:hypothetical protein
LLTLLLIEVHPNSREHHDVEALPASRQKRQIRQAVI